MVAEDTQSRWRQRFDNLKRAFARMQHAAQVVTQNSGDDILQAGLIQMYGFTFELAWKTMKDYLCENGFDAKSPKETIRLAFQNGYITNGDDWMQALADRNITTHTYDEETTSQVEHNIIHIYLPMIEQMVEHFNTI